VSTLALFTLLIFGISIVYIWDNPECFWQGRVATRPYSGLKFSFEAIDKFRYPAIVLFGFLAAKVEEITLIAGNKICLASEFDFYI
jgi:hypothetical protein